MKFKNIMTGVILETSNEMVISQLRSNSDYEEVKEEKNKKSSKKED